MAQRDERQWTGDVPTHDPPRRWVVWGTGERFPDAPFAYGASNDIAGAIASGADELWSYRPQKWIAIVDADEQTVDEWAEDTGCSYAPYLVEAKNEEVAPPMAGTLRNDVAPRRKVDQPRPS